MKRVLNAGETRSTNKNGTKLNRETRCKCQIKTSTSYLRGASEPDKCVVPLSPLWTFKSLFLPELGGCVLWQNVRQLNSHGSLSWRWAPLLRSRSTGNWTNERKSLPVVPSACFFFFMSYKCGGAVRREGPISSRQRTLNRCQRPSEAEDFGVLAANRSEPLQVENLARWERAPPVRSCCVTDTLTAPR